MTRYFFNLHECGSLIEDAEGIECASLEGARDVALENARDVMIGELRTGQLCLGCYISVVDASSVEVARVNFSDAVVITGL